MKIIWRISLTLVLIIALLGTLAVAGLLSWIGDQDTIRIIIDGEPWQFSMPSGWGLVGILAAVALSIILLFTVVPVLVVIALAVGLIGTLIGGLFAIAPVVIVVALIAWLVQRSRQTA
jgi:hypothetical protein